MKDYNRLSSADCSSLFKINVSYVFCGRQKFANETWDDKQGEPRYRTCRIFFWHIVPYDWVFKDNFLKNELRLTLIVGSTLRHKKLSQKKPFTNKSASFFHNWKSRPKSLGRVHCVRTQYFHSLQLLDKKKKHTERNAYECSPVCTKYTAIALSNFNTRKAEKASDRELFPPFDDARRRNFDKNAKCTFRRGFIFFSFSWMHFRRRL